MESGACLFVWRAYVDGLRDVIFKAQRLRRVGGPADFRNALISLKRLEYVNVCDIHIDIDRWRGPAQMAYFAILRAKSAAGGPPREVKTSSVMLGTELA
jgi:hypothetical protein